MKIALMYGGRSTEHDISIITACMQYGYGSSMLKIYIDEQNRWWQVLRAITPLEHKGRKRRNIFRPVIILPNDDRLFCKFGGLLIPICKIDCALLCFHGVNGEDGAIQGLLNLSGIAYTGCGLTASAVGMDKITMKQVFGGLNLPIAPFVALNSSEMDEETAILAKITQKIDFPIIVKPANLGSSIGISVANDPLQLLESLKVAFSFDNRAVAEKALDCFEVNCSCLVNYGEYMTSDVIKPKSEKEILTFSDKYIAKNVIANDLYLGEFAAKIKETTANLCKEMNVKGVARVDYLVTSDGFFVNEINTIPGSLAYPHWQKKFTRREFLKILIDNAMENFDEKQSLTYTYSSQVLTPQGKMKK